MSPLDALSALTAVETGKVLVESVGDWAHDLTCLWRDCSWPGNKGEQGMSEFTLPASLNLNAPEP